MLGALAQVGVNLRKESVVAMLQGFDYVRPRDLTEALDILSQDRVEARPLAGGTDLFVNLRAGKVRPELLVDISQLHELKGIKVDSSTVKVGAAVCLSDLARSQELAEHGKLLVKAIKTMGSLQIRNRGTIGGNLANASPAADTAVPLLALGATLELRNRWRVREVPVEDFFLGPGSTVLEADEIITEIGFPTAKMRKGDFLKLGRRNALAISVASVAVVVEIDLSERTFGDVRIALGAVAPTPIRAASAENTLHGQPISEEVVEQAARLALEDTQPISDVRASADYRKEVVKILLKRALRQSIAT